MREILFRGKRINNGEWVEGSLCQEGDNDAVIIESLSCYSDGFMQAFGAAVDPATVGQFTGLLDKNGKRIFEGDIIRSQSRLYGVEWVQDGFGAYDSDGNGGPLSLFAERYPVIGNIHDNPELL